MKDDLKQLDAKDNINTAPSPKTGATFVGWNDVKREDLPYGGIFWPKSYKFQVQSASAATVAHYSAMDETNPLSVQAALTHVVNDHIRILDGDISVKPLDVIHESMRFWFCMLVHSYTGNSTSLEAAERCPECGNHEKLVITPHVIQFTEATNYVTDRTDTVTGIITQKTKSYGDLVYQPITLTMRAELLSYMQEKYQKKDNFDMQFLSYAPLIFPQRTEGMSMDDLYKKVYFPMTQDVKKFSVFTKIIRTVALEQLLTIAAECSKCHHRFQADISSAKGLSTIFLDADVDDELL